MEEQNIASAATLDNLPLSARWIQCYYFIFEDNLIAYGSQKYTYYPATFKSLVILFFTECSAGLECSLPDAARWHSSLEDTHIGAQLCRRFEKYVWPVWKIYLRRSSHRIHSFPISPASSTAAKTCQDWKVQFLNLTGEEGSFAAFVVLSLPMAAPHTAIISVAF